MNGAGSSCFLENRNLFSDPSTSPEKYNLYEGLTHLSIAVNNILSKVEQIDGELKDLKYGLHQHGHI